MTGAKWMTSGAQRLKANLNRSFGSRKNRKDSHRRKEVGIIKRTSIVSAIPQHYLRSESKWIGSFFVYCHSLSWLLSMMWALVGGPLHSLLWVVRCRCRCRRKFFNNTLRLRCTIQLDEYGSSVTSEMMIPHVATSLSRERYGMVYGGVWYR